MISTDTVLILGWLVSDQYANFTEEEREEVCDKYGETTVVDFYMVPFRVYVGAVIGFSNEKDSIDVVLEEDEVGDILQHGIAAKFQELYETALQNAKDLHFNVEGYPGLFLVNTCCE